MSYPPPIVPPPPTPPEKSAACNCAHCRSRHLMGPVVLIALGVLLALQTVWHRWRFEHTWPVLLIVIGLVKLIQHLTPADPLRHR